MRQQPGHGLGGGGHVGVAEHRQRGRAGRGDQADGGLQGQREGALGAGQELSDVGAVLRQQVLERVARHLAGEPPELGSDRGQVPVDQGVQARQELGGRARPGPRRRARPPAAAPGGEAVPVPVSTSSAMHVVGGPAVPQRPRAAGVVADRAADGGPGVRGGVGPEAEPVRRGGGGDVVEHGPRLDQRRLLLRVDRDHPVEVLRQVEHEAGGERVAGDRGAAAAGDDRRVQLAADGQGGDDLVGAARERDDLGDDPVVGGVGRVLRPPPGRGLDLGQPGRAQPGGQLLGVDGLPWRDGRPRGHHSRKPSRRRPVRDAPRRLSYQRCRAQTTFLRF